MVYKDDEEMADEDRSDQSSGDEDEEIQEIHISHKR
jgi:hypothetical protein